MILGLTIGTFTAVHVLISLVAIATGLAFVFRLMAGKLNNPWAGVFLITTIATSVTGFLFPLEKLLPSHILGILSLIVLALALLARYAFHNTGVWRKVYIIGCVVPLYFNVFVLVVQSFQKVPMLAALAPTQSEPPFAIAQVNPFCFNVGHSFGPCNSTDTIPISFDALHNVSRSTLL